MYVVIAVCLWKLIKYLFVFIYDAFRAHKMEYFKVVAPRWDSKADRDIQKELAKDMKEKIWRMAQVFTSIHKLWELSVMDNIMRRIFNKPKITFLMHYEDGLLYFIVWTYPEYKQIVESAIAAQYADASMEEIATPSMFDKKYVDVMPMQPTKNAYYPIRIFKQLEDDPLNNIIDGIWKISAEDTFTVVLTLRPAGTWFTKKAQKYANALYMRDQSILNKWKLWRKLLFPWEFINFLRKWPSEKLIKKFAPDRSQWDPIIRMTKAEEEALNTMAEEAWKMAFEWWIMLISTSDAEWRPTQNINNIVSGYSVYADQYNNTLDQPEWIADLLWPIVNPLWKMSVIFLVPWFFYKKWVFTVNELASLYHFPDGLYNRSPVIKWMNYKTLAAPDALPQLKEENLDFVITGIIAEQFKWGNLGAILAESKHDAVWEKVETIKLKKEVPKWYKSKADHKVIEEEWKYYLIWEKKKKEIWLKTYKDGILLWVNVYRNRYTPVYMKRKDRTRHHYIIGKSGTGKSVYISMLARQDIWKGDGVCVIDPHGDLVQEILEYVPKERAKDVIYFDAWNEQRPMGLNLYEISHPAEADRAVNDAVEIFIKMFGPEIFWPRIQEYFKYGSLTLLEDMEEWATLIDVPRLFTDEIYREYKTKKVRNPVVRNFRDRTYNAMGDREKQEIIPYFTSKFVSFITNSLIRNIIGQTKSAFDFSDVMDNQKILLINLSKWRIGELNAQLLWMIMVSKIYNAAMARARMAEKDRKFFFLYVDEFQNFVTDTFADILSEARKYKLCLIMAHQFIAQLESNAWNNIGEGKSKVKDAVFGNVGTMQSFKVWAPDAEFLEKEYAPALGMQDILGIANYKAYVKLNINNTTSRVFSMNSIWTQDYKSPKVAEILKQYSEKKYGRKKEFVDAEIAARLGMLGEEDGWDEWQAWPWWMPGMQWWLPGGLPWFPPGMMPPGQWDS